MAYMEKVPYQYWTGLQWESKYIEVGPVMSTGWHIFNTIATLVFLPYGLVYLYLYVSGYNEKERMTSEALAQINDYYARLAKDLKADKERADWLNDS